jgi:hypothetical protein
MTIVPWTMEHFWSVIMSAAKNLALRFFAALKVPGLGHQSFAV